MTFGKKPLSPMRRRAVDRLLIQYLELPERQQQQWLEQSAQRLPRLTAWLRRLTADSHTVTLLDESMRRLAGESVERMEFHARQLSPGDRLGPWQVIAEVGAGGMGRVYRGLRADGAFEMEVAIKQIGQRRRGLAELLQRECRLLARLDHPSVTRLVDAGLDDQAGPFLVMEWIEGQDLSVWLAREKPDLQTRLDLFERIAEAVAHAHQRLIVHGDIKPNNIRIREDGSVKLMDFGVARLLADDPYPHRVAGLTPSFSSPEVMNGEPVSPRSDIWALGAMLYWLITESAISEKSHPATQSLKSVNLHRGREIRAMVEKATAEHIDDRYETAYQFLDDLQRFRDYLPLNAVAPTHLYRLSRFVRRNRLIVSSAAAIILLLSSGLTATVSLYLSAEQARQSALIERDRAEQHAAEVALIADFQAERLGRIDVESLGVFLRQSLFARHDEHLDLEQADALIREQARAELEKALAGVNFSDLALDSIDTHLFSHSLSAINDQFYEQPVLRARLLQTLSSSAREVGILDLAYQAQSQALALRRQHLGDEHPDTLSSLDETGAIKVLLGDWQEANDLLQFALEGREAKLGSDHPDTLETLNNLGAVKHRLNDLEAAQAFYSRALEGRARVLGADHPKTLESMLSMGVLLRWQGDFEQATEYHAHALNGFRKSLGEDHQQTIDAVNQMGYVLAEQGQLEEALPFLQQSKTDFRRTLGDRHPKTLYAISDVGVILMRLNRLDEARPYLERAMNGRRQALGPSHPHMVFSLNFMSHYHVRAGEPELAEQLLRELIARRQQILGDPNAGTLVVARRLGETLIQLERPEEALDWFDQAATGLLAIHGQGHPDTARAWIGKAEALLATQRQQQALAAADQAVRFSATAWPDGHQYQSQAIKLRAKALAAKGAYAEAETDFLSAYERVAEQLGPEHSEARAVAESLAGFYRRWSDADPKAGHELTAGQWEERQLIE